MQWTRNDPNEGNSPALLLRARAVSMRPSRITSEQSWEVEGRGSWTVMDVFFVCRRGQTRSKDQMTEFPVMSEGGIRMHGR